VSKNNFHMIKSTHKLLACIVFLLTSLYSYSVPATPYPITRIQPDGSELTVYLRGDEFFNYELTVDGYLIRRNSEGFYNYAQKGAQGELISTNIKVNQVHKRTDIEKQLLSRLPQYPDFSQKRIERKAARVAAASGLKKSFPNTGSPKSLVILVNFKDIAFTIPNPKTAFNNLLNQEGYSENGGTGSARDYFKAASNGISAPEFVVVGPYTLTNNRSYYGANDNTTDEDVKPREMVIDACNAAAADGVDFSIYDTDEDGVVDNVFIYYAGHNEAEGGPKESVWPHRWSLNSTLTLNGKRIIGYACTSELKESTGTNMCGIGTFAHEFGHVYGLVDYYPTNNAKHHTLSFWNIMDAGAYLNDGRTPPTYSAYDRFYLAWITPVILKSPRDVKLTDLKLSNRAYIITRDGNHNLNGASPNPVEFFMLENRQKTGWDRYLPNSGMLITRVYYNATTWQNNEPNNNASAMGVDIMEADGMADDNSLRGDPFPGSTYVTSYAPTLRNGTNISKPITNIKETAGVITFDFMGGGVTPIITTDLENITRFSTQEGVASQTQKFTVSGQHLKSNIIIDFGFNTFFELKREDDLSDNWSKSIELIATDSTVENTSILIRYFPTEASFDETHYEYLNIRSEDSDIEQAVIKGSSSRPVYVVPPVANNPASATLNGYRASWNAVYDASGYYLTAYNISEGTSFLKEGFNDGLKAPIDWTIESESLNNTAYYAGDSVPSIQLSKTGDFIQTESYALPVTELSFFIRSIGEMMGSVELEAWNGTTWSQVETMNVTLSLNTVKKYTFKESDGFIRFRITFNKGLGFVSIDDITVRFSKKIEFNARNKWTKSTSSFIDFLTPDRIYYYSVRASDRTLNPNNTVKYENITEPSNLVEIRLDNNITQFSNKEKVIDVFVDSNDNIILDKGSHTEENKIVFIYTSDGKIIQQIETESQIVPIKNLRKNQLYILKCGNTSIKIIH